MSAESIPVIIAVLAAFAAFSAVLAWQSVLSK